MPQTGNCRTGIREERNQERISATCRGWLLLGTELHGLWTFAALIRLSLE
jgi:hypothetical protein